MKRMLLSLAVVALAPCPRPHPRAWSSSAPDPRSRPRRAVPATRAGRSTRSPATRDAPDNLKNPFFIRRDGYLVAFTVTLPELAQNQIDSFNARFGGAPSVRLSDASARATSARRASTTGCSGSRTSTTVENYLGSSPTFVLKEPLRVKKGNIVALTVPTWVPALAADLTGSNWWRSSRLKGKCGSDDALAPPSDAGDPARDHPLRLHLQARAAPLHRHVHSGPASDHARRGVAPRPVCGRVFPRPRGRASIGP